MAEIAAVTALGIFIIGAVAGIIAVVSLGIRREDLRFQEERRFREEHGIWGSPEVPVHYLPENPHDGVSSISRSLNGLFVRHLKAGRPLRADRGRGG